MRKNVTTLSVHTPRSVVQIFQMLLDSHNYKYSDVNLAQVLTPVRVRSNPSTCVRNRKVQLQTDQGLQLLLMEHGVRAPSSAEKQKIKTHEEKGK